jgi:hypothetical protein
MGEYPKFSSRGITPLLGFVLMLAIIMGFIGILQSYAVPQWNKAVEIQHLDRLIYDVSEISEVVALSTTTGSGGKLVLEGGVKYPSRPFLISPSQTSITVYPRELRITVNGNDYTSHAIIVVPNYFYLSRPTLIYEHSAVFEEYYGQSPSVKSNQSSFSPGRITLYIINTSMTPISSTDPINLIFEPVSYGGSVHYASVTLSFESYDNQTAEWWNRTINSIPGFTAVRSGNFVTVTATDVDLSLNEVMVYATSAREVRESVSPVPFELINLSDQSYTVYTGTTISLGVRVVDKFGNPVSGTTVNIDVNPNTPLNPDESQISDERGEVWYYFNADVDGSYTVTFSIPADSYTYSITVNPPPPAGGGGACIFNAYWLEGSNLTWNVSIEGLNKILNFKVEYAGSPVYNAQVYFALTNASVVSASSYEARTNTSGIAQINLTALANGFVSVIGTVASCVDVINLTVEGVGALNNPPTPPTLITDKDRYYSGETIIATASGSVDPDGDPITYYYRFDDYTLGTILQDWSTVNTYTITVSEEGHIIRVYAKACDDRGACSTEVYKDVGVIKVVVLYPTDDAFVDQLYPNSNFGNDPDLLVDSCIWWKDRTFIKFDLSSIPSGSYVLNGTLQLYMYDTRAVNRNYGAHRVTDLWSEATITWNTQPTFSATATDVVSVSLGWLSWNVTADVADIVSGGTNYGWCIKDEFENTAALRYSYIHSSEYSVSVYWPRLIVKYSPI